MNIVRIVWKEFIGMFIDDGALAIWSLVLIAVVSILVKGVGVPPLWGALGLFAGCLLVLGESVLRAIRKH